MRKAYYHPTKVKEAHKEGGGDKRRAALSSFLRILLKTIITSAQRARGDPELFEFKRISGLLRRFASHKDEFLKISMNQTDSVNLKMQEKLKIYELC